MTLTVIVPTLNEQALLPACLDAIALDNADEVLVVDGGSDDQTRDIARRRGVRVIISPRGRASQMNAAVRETTCDHLLFCHADTILPLGYRTHIEAILSDPAVALGAFRFALPKGGLANRIVEFGVAFRCATLDMPYGDQALFCRRDDFFAAGGFPPPPALEDMALVLNLRRHGRIRLAPAAVLISDREWKKRGYTALTTHYYFQAARYLVRRAWETR